MPDKLYLTVDLAAELLQRAPDTIARAEAGAATRTTVGLPGSGLSYTHLGKPGHRPPEASAEPVQTSSEPQGSAARGWVWIALLAAIAAWLANFANVLGVR